MMNQIKTRVAFAAVIMISMNLTSAQPSFAQDDQQRQSELGARQRLVQRKMAELENQFTSMAEKIRASEPERAQRLIDAYQQAKETLITRKMADIGRWLDQGEYDKAEESIEIVIVRLNDLVKLLLNTQPEKQDKQEQIAQYEQWRKSIQEMQRNQNSQRRETQKVANKDSEMKKLDGQIKKLDNLIERQSNLIEETKSLDGGGLRAMDKVADKQFELRTETDDLRLDVEGDSVSKQNAGNNNVDNDDAEAKKNGSGQKQTDGNAQQSATRKNEDEANAKAEPNDSEIQPSDEQKSQSKQQSGQGSPGQKSDHQQSGQQQSDQQQSGQPQPSQQSSGSRQSSPSKRNQDNSQSQQPQPGQQPLKQASRSQEKAEEKLGSGRPKDAERQQQKALADLENARIELKKERRRLASLPPEAVKQMAQKQRRTRDKAMDLVEKMEQAPTPEENSDKQQVSKQNPGQQPGKQQMQQAAEAMQNASKNLDEQETRKAEQKQREAEKKLDEALEEIEERLNQLRDETREEKLKRLEGRFKEMLDRQRTVSAITIEMEDKKLNLGQLQRRDQLVVLRLAVEENGISELGQQAYDLLLEDGTSEVFPEMVQDLISSLVSAGQMLQNERTDQLTQLLQQGIESSLMDLLEALAESKEKNDQGGGGGGGGGGDQPLLKLSAELKMLKAAQQRLNRKTRQLDSIKHSQNSATDQLLDQEIEGMSDVQSKLQEMAEQIMEKSN